MAIISIENKICEADNHNEMINELATKRARRGLLHFLYYFFDEVWHKIIEM